MGYSLRSVYNLCESLLLLLRATMGAVIKFLPKSLAAAKASHWVQILSRCIYLAGFVGNMTASFALYERLTLPNTQYGYKEKGQIIIRAN